MPIGSMYQGFLTPRHGEGLCDDFSYEYSHLGLVRPTILAVLYIWDEFLWGLEAKSFIGAIPQELLLTILYQIFYVALPEEFFYRGYFQTRLNELYPSKMELVGNKHWEWVLFMPIYSLPLVIRLCSSNGGTLQRFSRNVVCLGT